MLALSVDWTNLAAIGACYVFGAAMLGPLIFRIRTGQRPYDWRDEIRDERKDMRS